jgi:hypothetical protein
VPGWDQTEKRERIAGAWTRLANEYDALADALEADANKRTHQHVAEMVGDRLEKLFGLRFHSQAAVIAGVILDEPVSRRTAERVAARRVSPKPTKKPVRRGRPTKRKKH